MDPAELVAAPELAAPVASDICALLVEDLEGSSATGDDDRSVFLQSSVADDVHELTVNEIAPLFSRGAFIYPCDEGAKVYV